MMHHQANSFSMLFKPSYDENDQYHQMIYPFASSSSSSSVDCTLSLGTPSTRGGYQSDERRRASSRSGSKFGFWDFVQGKSSSSSGSDGSNNGMMMINSDPLLARRCANCDTTSTPLWRNGPRGPKSLCNACGIRFKKEERRATAATATASSGGMDGVHNAYQNNNTWSNNPSQKVPCFSPANEFRFIDDSDTTHHDTGSGGGIPFLPWMLNVADRPTGLVHDFTR